MFKSRIGSCLCFMTPVLTFLFVHFHQWSPENDLSARVVFDARQGIYRRTATRKQAELELKAKRLAQGISTTTAQDSPKKEYDPVYVTHDFGRKRSTTCSAPSSPISTCSRKPRAAKKMRDAQGFKKEVLACPTPLQVLREAPNGNPRKGCTRSGLPPRPRF